jgi:periplasmic protein TonB
MALAMIQPAFAGGAPAPRMNRRSARAWALAGTLAIHALAAAYIISWTFKPGQEELTPDDPMKGAIVQLPPPTRDKIKPPPVTHRETTPRHVELNPGVTTEKFDPIPLAPIDPTPTKPGPDTATAPETPKAPPVITNPDWLRLPTGEQVADAYPERAARMGIGGQVTLSCQVNAAGAVGPCQAVNETPADFGFAKAGLSLTRYFKMKPRMVDGHAVAGGVVRIPIKFNPAPQ